MSHFPTKLLGASERAPVMVESLPETQSTITDDLTRVVADLEGAAAFLKSRYMENLIVQTLRAEVQRAQSPLCDRAGAAQLAMCDPSQIDRAAKAGIIKRHFRGETPMFEKADIIEAITSGRWNNKK